MRPISFAVIASSMLFSSAVLADDLVIDSGIGPEFYTHVERENVQTYDGDIAVGVDLPETYEVSPVPDVIITKYPKLKGYRYVRVGKRIAIVSPSSRKVVRYIEIKN